MTEPWAGRWAEENAGIVVRTVGSPTGERLEGLVGIGLRLNPKRAQLLVSTVLGKHVPADPRTVRDAGLRLGRLVGSALSGEPVFVIGFAETATLLGHLVADSLGAPYIHSTRRLGNEAINWATFTEAHSHAPSHALQPWPPTLMASEDVIVLVDDELSTARTAVRTIRTLHARAPRRGYVIASLIDMRSGTDRVRVERVARELGVRIECVSLVRGEIQLPARAFVPTGPSPALLPDATGRVARVTIPWPDGVRESGRHGFQSNLGSFDRAISDVAAVVAAMLNSARGRTHVLGTEELMYAPLRVALELPGDVTFSTTTRSPAIVLDVPGYALRHGLTFPAHESGASGIRYAYNLEAGRYDQIVLILDADSDTPEADGLIEELRRLTGSVVVVTLPTYCPPAPLRGPSFGTYPATDVAWLLADISATELEAPTGVREYALQSGGHYAESLPIEYQPDVGYEALFHEALRRTAERVALAVSVVGEQILERRGSAPLLVSLARAGTPVGVLLRRWAASIHRLDWTHYSISIVRDRGIDELALSYIASRHDSRDVVFVDGWTGKGAIARELAAAVAQVNSRLGTAFSDQLAVLADPGHCVDLFGTRDDLLIPSACLNSTVSGLVSRTVLNPSVLRDDQFHGAKFYRALAESDISNEFVDAVAAHFIEVQRGVGRRLTELAGEGRRPDWRGWASVRRIADVYGITDLNLVKPGIGEATRVLLRRMPWRILVRPGCPSDVAHIRYLAAKRGVPVVEVSDLPFACVGLIQPKAGRSEQ